MKQKKLNLLFLSLIIALGMISLTIPTVKAADLNVVNEYELIKSEYDLSESRFMLSGSHETLQELKRNQEKIERLKNQIYELKGLSIEELKCYNYTDDQIEAIKTYDGSEEKSIKAAAVMSFSVKKNTFSYNSSTGLSTVEATVNFTWNGAPEDWGDDCFAMAFEADNNHNFQAIKTVSSTVKYNEWKSASNVKVWTKSATDKGDQGVSGSYGWGFPVSIKGDQNYAYISSGSFTLTGVVSGKLLYSHIHYIYSHRTFYFGSDFGISISKGEPSVGINFEAKSRFVGYPSNMGGIVTFS